MTFDLVGDSPALLTPAIGLETTCATWPARSGPKTARTRTRNGPGRSQSHGLISLTLTLEVPFATSWITRGGPPQVLARVADRRDPEVELVERPRRAHHGVDPALRAVGEHPLHSGRRLPWLLVAPAEEDRPRDGDHHDRPEAVPEHREQPEEADTWRPPRSAESGCVSACRLGGRRGGGVQLGAGPPLGRPARPLERLEERRERGLIENPAAALAIVDQFLGAADLEELSAMAAVPPVRPPAGGKLDQLCRRSGRPVARARRENPSHGPRCARRPRPGR